MQFGKYKGKSITELPDHYLRWVLGHAEMASPQLRAAIKAVLSGGATVTPRNVASAPVTSGEIVAAIQAAIRDVYREMSGRFHPDHSNGSTEGQIAINAMRDRLAEVMPARVLTKIVEAREAKASQHADRMLVAGPRPGKRPTYAVSGPPLLKLVGPPRKRPKAS